MHRNAPAEKPNANPVTRCCVSLSCRTPSMKTAAPTGHISAKPMLTALRSIGERPAAVITLPIDSASSGLCKAIAANVPMPASQPADVVCRFDRGSECHAVDQRVNREAQQHADPTQFVCGGTGVVRVTVRATCSVRMVMRFFDSGVMSVEVERANQQKHEHETRCEGVDRVVQVAGLLHRVRQQLKESDAQHQAADTAHHHLHSCVREPDHAQQAAPRERGECDHDRIRDEQRRPIVGKSAREGESEKINRKQRTLQQRVGSILKRDRRRRNDVGRVSKSRPLQFSEMSRSVL